jgi:hypothetical protein
VFSGEIVAGPNPAMLRSQPQKFAAEQKLLIAAQKKMAAEANRVDSARKHFGTMAKRSAAAAQKKAKALAQRPKVAHVSAVDHLLHSGGVSVKKIVAKARVARRNPHA